MTADFSSETLQVRKQWSNIFEALKEKAAGLEPHTQRDSFQK
jgi:hypothetical protein